MGPICGLRLASTTTYFCLFRVLALPGKDHPLKKKDALIKKAILDELHTTENPLWMEQKLKLYEEQELTMQVFIDELRHAEDNASQVNRSQITLSQRG